MRRLKFSEVSEFAIWTLVNGSLVPPFQLAGISRYPGRAECDYHRVSSYYLSLTLEGRMEYEEMGNPPCVCTPGTLLLIPVYNRFCWRVLEPATAFQCALRGFSIQEHEVLATLFGSRLESIGTVPLGMKWVERIRTCCAGLPERTYSGVYLSGVLLELCASALEAAEKNGFSGSGSRDSASVRCCICFVEEHLSEPFTLSEMAKACNMSLRKLFYLFRNHLGMAPHRYIAARKVELAERLLRTNMSSGEIASELGFSDANYFIRFFSRETGETPETRRRNMKHYRGEHCR